PGANVSRGPVVAPKGSSLESRHRKTGSAPGRIPPARTSGRPFGRRASARRTSAHARRSRGLKPRPADRAGRHVPSLLSSKCKQAVAIRDGQRRRCAMARHLFVLRVTVKDGERAFLTRNGRIERVLEPGRHTLFDPRRELTAELFNVVRAEFPAERFAV